MKTYHYDETTKEYTHSEEAFLDPLESKMQGKSVYLLPANATFIVPIEKEGYANIWNGETWEQFEDNRGKEYWLDTDEYGTHVRIMKELGTLPQNAVFKPPKKTLEQVKEAKIASLKTQRDEMEVQPIEYKGHLYDYDDKARDRINAAIIALDLQGDSAYLSWTCADQSEAVVTANDLRSVIASVAVRSNALHVAYRNAKTAVMNAETVEEVQAVILEV